MIDFLNSTRTENCNRADNLVQQRIHSMTKEHPSSNGANVVGVGSAREAIAALRAFPEQFDVLSADIGMPDQDGFSLIRQVRVLEAGGQIPAAAITAYVSDQERQRTIESGFQRHLAKPVNLTQLIRTIAELVGRSL